MVFLCWLCHTNLRVCKAIKHLKVSYSSNASFLISHSDTLTCLDIVLIHNVVVMISAVLQRVIYL